MVFLRTPALIVAAFAAALAAALALTSGVQGSVHAPKVSLKQLQAVLAQERELKRQRLRELDQWVKDLESRQKRLAQKIQAEEGALRGSLRNLHAEHGSALRAQAIARVATAQQRRLEGLKADQTDHDEIQARIQRERAELESLVQDLRENASIAQFYGEAEKTLKSKASPEISARLEKLHRMRSQRAEVDELIKGFVARSELQETQDAEEKARGAMALGAFAKLRGQLALPVDGTIVGEWGRIKDPDTGLYVFRKGIEIQSTEPISVEARSVAAGRVVFAGPLGDYGRAVVIDHGANHYTLTGRLGKTVPALGTFVRAGEGIGYSYPRKPIYFEIRAGRTPVNPLQWTKR